MKHRPGAALLLTILISGTLMVLAVILVKMVYNDYLTADCSLRREQAFWLAEAGLEKGKVELKHDPGWYTDLPHQPADDLSWLRSAAVGQREILEEGAFKLVHEFGKEEIYSVGYRSNAIVVLKLKGTNWKEI